MGLPQMLIKPDVWHHGMAVKRVVWSPAASVLSSDRFVHHPKSRTNESTNAVCARVKVLVDSLASNYKCIASNKCLTGSNKKLVITILIKILFVASSKALVTSSFLPRGIIDL